MTEAVHSSETSVLTRATLRNIPGDGILHSHSRELLKSYNTCLIFSVLPLLPRYHCKMWRLGFPDIANQRYLQITTLICRRGRRRGRSATEWFCWYGTVHDVPGSTCIARFPCVLGTLPWVLAVTSWLPCVSRIPLRRKLLLGCVVTSDVCFLYHELLTKAPCIRKCCMIRFCIWNI
jgi:hypothetical protein